jgi:hypothetical protein
MSASAIEGLLIETEQNFRNDWKNFGGISTGDFTTYNDPEGQTAGYYRDWSPRERPRS